MTHDLDEKPNILKINKSRLYVHTTKDLEYCTFLIDR